MTRPGPTWHVKNVNSREWRNTEIFLGVWRGWEVYLYPFEWGWVMPASCDYGAEFGPFFLTTP